MGILGSSWKDDEDGFEPVIKHFKSEIKDDYNANIMSHLKSEDSDNLDDFFDNQVIKHFKD